MIIGVGSDLIDIRRIAKTLKRYPGKFEKRCFTEIEREKTDNRSNRTESYAKRYAAKEACSKALGTGFRQGVFWSDIGVVNMPGGKPTLELTGGALRRLREITPSNMIANINVSITDEFPIAQVIVIISGVTRK